MLKKWIFLFLFFVAFSGAAFAQTITFNYQGRLNNGGMSANGNYDFEFRLYDQGAGGNLIGVQQVLNVPVAGGVFNVNLEFGATAFPGANRFLEISVTTAGGAGFTVLAPRQQILSAPYSIKSLNAANADNAAKLGGINAGNFVQQDAGGNVSIAGNFTVNGSLSLNTVNAQTQYNLGGQRILGANSFSLSLGVGAGNPNSSNASTFLGQLAGSVNTGGANTFIGFAAGIQNTSGGGNSFVGSNAGYSNTTGSSNIFIGNAAGSSNTTGVNNLTNATAIGANSIVSQSNSLILGNNANVGIGTSTPNSKLTVVGLIETTTGGVKFPDGTIQTTASTGSVNAILNQTTPQTGANFNVAGNGTVGGTLTANKVQATSDSFVLGNFGIGTAAPLAKLDVTGGNILIDTAGSGIILKSPGGTCRLLSIDNAGAMVLTAVSCS